MADKFGMLLLGGVLLVALAGVVVELTNSTTGEVSVSLPKKYTRGQLDPSYDRPYLYTRTAGGFPSTAGVPPADYYPEGFWEEETGITRQEDVGRYGRTVARARSSYGRQEYFIPSGQMCAALPDQPGVRCPIINGVQTTCIPDRLEAESGGWIPAPVHPCYLRASQ